MFHPFSFSRLGVTAVVTNRKGGVSGGIGADELASLNLSYAVGDDPTAVSENRQIVGQKLNFKASDLVVPCLQHGVRVVAVDDRDAGRGALSLESGISQCDALITKTLNLPLAICVADSMPVVLLDTRLRVAGLAHAGWRGTVGRIAQRTVEAMSQTFGSCPGDLLVGIGPGLQTNSLAVEEKEANLAQDAFPGQPAVRYIPEHRPRLDMTFMLKQQLLDAGVPLRNIEDMGIDTLNDSRFFSSRCQPNKSVGRFMAIVMLRP